jgi:hypothetical protein
MAKPLFQDIIPPDRRSIKRINRTNEPSQEHIPIRHLEDRTPQSEIIRQRTEGPRIVVPRQHPYYETPVTEREVQAEPRFESQAIHHETVRHRYEP